MYFHHQRKKKKLTRDKLKFQSIHRTTRKKIHLTRRERGAIFPTIDEAATRWYPNGREKQREPAVTRITVAGKIHVGKWIDYPRASNTDIASSS